MPSEDVAISVTDLTKSYRLFGHPGDRIKQFFSLGLKQYYREFTAIQDVSFDIRRGESVGIIGRNGSGKSTLLQLICGILKPTAGHIRVNGSVSALLELGAGFNPEFTGRENVYFQSALIGLTKAQVDERFDEIAAFADIGEFLDQPVRTYSSGMFVRLAFATMIHADADVLVIDEALAVGDESFQRRCLKKLEGQLDGGETVLLFVSHNLRQVERVCTRALLLEDHRIISDGPPSQVCTAYQQKIYLHSHQDHDQMQLRPNITDSGEIVVRKLQLFDGDSKNSLHEFEFRSLISVVVDFECKVPVVKPEIVVGFQGAEEVCIAAGSTAGVSESFDLEAGVHRIECKFFDVALLPGHYAVRLAFFDRFRRPVWVGHKLSPFRIVAKPGTNLMHIPLGLVDLPHEWTLIKDRTV